MDHVKTRGRFPIWFMEGIFIIRISGNIKFGAITSNEIVFAAKFFERKFKVKFQ